MYTDMYIFTCVDISVDENDYIQWNHPICMKVTRQLNLQDELYKVTRQLNLQDELYKVTRQLNLQDELYKVTRQLNLQDELYKASSNDI